MPLYFTDCSSRTFFFFFHFFKKCYWGIVDLQCWDTFCCTTKWFHYTYTHIHSYLDFFPIYLEYGKSQNTWVPCATLRAVISEGGAAPHPPHSAASRARTQRAGGKSEQLTCCLQSKMALHQVQAAGQLYRSPNRNRPRWDLRARAIGMSQAKSHQEMLPVMKQNMPEGSPKRAAEDQSSGKQTPSHGKQLPGQPEHC